MWEIFLSGGKSITVLCSDGEFNYILNILKGKYKFVLPVDIKTIEEKIKSPLTIN